MRIALAIVLAGAVAALGLGGLAAFNLETFVAAHRDELLTRGERLLERPLRVGTVAASWWPVGIRFTNVSVGEDPRFGTAPFLDAAAARVTMHPWSLAVGRTEVSGVVLDAPRVRLRRDARGHWNVGTLGAAEARDAAAVPPNGPKRRRGLRIPAAWLVNIPPIEVRDGVIEVEDDGAAPPRRLHAEHVRMHARDIRLGGAPRVRAEAALFGGSGNPDAHLDLHVTDLGQNDGERTPFTVRLELDDVDLATLASWNGAQDLVSGRVADVTIDASGTLERGELNVEAHGADAPIRLRPGWTLPAVPTSIRARAAYDRDQIVIDGAEATIGTLRLEGTGSTKRAPWRGVFTVRSKDGSALELGLAHPPTRLTDLALRLAIDDDVMRAEPLTARLDGAPVACRGGTRSLVPLVFAAGCHAEVFGGSLATDVELAPDASRLAVRGDGHALDVGAIIARLAPELAGRIGGEADATFTLGVPIDGRHLRRELAGSGRVVMGEGRLLNLNPVERVLGSGGGMRLFPRLLSARTRSRFPEIFAGGNTAFTDASVDFSVAAGSVVVEQLLLATSSYEMVGAGSIDRERQIRMHGDLVLSPELTAAFRDDLPVARILLSREPRLMVPFRMRGRIDEARLEPDLKRIRARGLQALVEGDRGSESLRDDIAPLPHLPGRERDEPRAVERLDRLLRP